MNKNPYEAEKWKKVKSSMIEAVGCRDNFLIVKFRDGSFYRYPELAKAFDRLVSAPSAGKYFHKHVRHKPNQKLDETWPGEGDG